MKKTKTYKILIVAFCVLLIIAIPVSAHPGSLDANGGHHVNGTGEYHYHHGYPAHQHENGECPYNFDDQTSQKSGVPNISTTESYELEATEECTQAYDEELKKAFAKNEAQKKQSKGSEITVDEKKGGKSNSLWEIIKIILCILFYGWIAVILIATIMPLFVLIATIPSKIKKNREKRKKKADSQTAETESKPVEPIPHQEENPIPEKKPSSAPELFPDQYEYLWIEWKESIHNEDGQSDRIKRAFEQNFKIGRRALEDEYQIIGTKGNQYITSLKSCTCPDFKFRKRPCKHMYVLAISQGLFVPNHYLNRPTTTPWSVWDDSIHRTKEQAERIQQAKNQNIVIFKRTRDDTYLILGTQGDKFLTSLQQCTCPDYQRRGLPCKHMYALAISEDVFAPLQYLPRPTPTPRPATKK